MELPDARHLTDRVPHGTGRGDPFAATVRATRMPMIITDPRQDDNPIVFVNDAFLNFTGYDRHEVMGRNCRFLQGAGTDRLAVGRIAEAIRTRNAISIDLLNYRKDGTTFWNALYVSPVFGEAGELLYYFASQLDVTDRREALAAKTALLHEVDHRVKNNLQMVSALIAMQASTIAEPQIRRSLDALLRRIEALSAVHRRLYQSEDVTRISVADFICDIATELVGVTGRDDVTIRLDLEPVDIPAEEAAPLALVVNELITNALKHALPSDRAGEIAVVVRRDAGRLLVEIEDDGVGMPARARAAAASAAIPFVPGPSAAGASPSSASMGQSLVRLLARQLRGAVTWSGVEPSGTRVVVEMPLGRSTSGARRVSEPV